METAHRRIELQSPADLSYLKANATRAARAKIDLHFPPSAAPESGEPDAMKKRVEELVDQYIQTIFTHAKSNISINGLEGDSMEQSLLQAETLGEELEAYDTKLASRIQNISAQIESLTLALANLRRQAPAQAAIAYNTRAQKERQEFETRLLEKEKERLEEAVRDVRTGAEELKRLDELRGTWASGTKTLAEVKERIGGTAARLEKAFRAAEYVDGQSG